MRIEIDTKEDLHNIRHIIRLLSAISGSMQGKDSYKFNDDLFSESSNNSSSSSVPETPPSLFNMFDTSSPSTSSSSSIDPLGIPNIFQEPKKDNEDTKDFIDRLQVY